MQPNRAELRVFPAFILVIVAGLAVASPALASDGVIEVNQAKVMASGGFPFTISKTGSYRLTSNLDLTASGQANPQELSAVIIAASGTELDLNGFAIVGPGNCGTTAPVTSCTNLGTLGTGVTVTTGTAVVRNGSVRGVAYGILGKTSAFVSVEHVTFSSDGFGIYIHDGGVVRDCTAWLNSRVGIEVNSNGLVVGSLAYGNAQGGFWVAGTATGNVANANGFSGIRVVGGLAKGNSAAGNGAYGLELTANTGYVANALTGNNGQVGNPNVSGGVSLGPNLCDSALCP